MPIKTTQLFQLELNEINFDFIQHYIDQGHLPIFAKLIERYGFRQTTSECRYEDVEPWIQWVTAHTGLTLTEHGVFRLGDIESSDIIQIWERLEQQFGIQVGAISPMNATNRTNNAAFFVPDPWTKTKVTGSYLVQRLYKAISQTVADNAASRIQLRSLFWLALGALSVIQLTDYGRYIELINRSRRRPWVRAIILDRLLADLFKKEVSRSNPQFATLFLNAGAHIQHHYMFSSSAYKGDQKNPAWYLGAGEDPLLEIYTLYDRIVGEVLAKFPDARLMLVTGLHQDPHPELTYYWRLRNHAEFLSKIGASFVRIEPRMSRDFLIVCKDLREACGTEKLLGSIYAGDNTAMFVTENRGKDLFVTLVYPREIDASFVYHIAGERRMDLVDDVVFVALKNGRHNSTGYFLDTGADNSASRSTIELRSLPDRIMQVFSQAG